MLTISASKFKTQCLKLMNYVQNKNEIIIITKRGVPVAKLVPFDEKPISLFGFMADFLTVKGDIIGPVEEK